MDRFVAVWILMMVLIFTTGVVGVVLIVNQDMAELTEDTVLGYITDHSPDQNMLERKFETQYQSSRQSVLISALDNLLTDNLIEYVEIGGYTVYRVVEVEA